MNSKMDKSLLHDVRTDSKITETVRYLEVDQVYEEIGQFGRFQKLIVILLLLLCVPYFYQLLILYFVGNNPPWRCAHNSTECTHNGTFSAGHDLYNDRCSMNRSSWEFVQNKEYSIVTQWDLVCENAYINYLTGSSLFIGWGLAILPIGFLSDRYGRKAVLYPCVFGLAFLTFIYNFVDNMWLFIATRLISGVFQGGIGLNVVVLCNELVGKDYRDVNSVLFGIVFVSILCFLTLQAWLIQNWKILGYVTSAPYLVLLFTYKIIPESIRWLRLNNQGEKAEYELKRIARLNKKEWPNIKLIDPIVNKEGKFQDLFRPKNMLKKTLMQCWIWFVTALGFFGISLASNQLGGDMYRDFILTSVVSLPAMCVLGMTLERFGRKKNCIASLAVTGLSCIAVAFIPTSGNKVYQWTRIALGMLGKGGSQITFGVIYVWSIELNPTVIRSQAMALMIVTSRMGASFAPWVAQFLCQFHPSLPFGVIGAMACIGAVVSYGLSETTGQPTKENIKYLNRFNGSTKIWSVL